MINTGLSNLSVEAGVLTPAYPNQLVLLVGTHEGIFRTEDESTWTSVSPVDMLSVGIEKITNSIYQLDTVPEMAVDSTGAVHIAWWGSYADNSAPDGIRTDVHYTNNQSGSFELPIRVDVPHDYFSLNVSIVNDPDNFTHLAFVRQDALSTPIWNRTLYYVNNRNGNFENLVLITDDSGPYGNPQVPSIAIDQNAHTHIAFSGTGGSSQRIWYTNNVTGTFITSVDVPEPGIAFGTSGRPSLAVDNSGNAHIAYLGETVNPFDDDVFYVNNVGGSFNPGINVSRNSGGEDCPQLVLDSFVKPHIVYEETFGPTYYTFEQTDSFVTSIIIPGIYGLLLLLSTI